MSKEVVHDADEVQELTKDDVTIGLGVATVIMAAAFGAAMSFGAWRERRRRRYYARKFAQSTSE